MNTIFLAERYDLQDGRSVMRFSCSDLVDLGIDTKVSRRERSEAANKVLDSIADRITLSLQKVGYEVMDVNFGSKTITARKV